MEKCVVKNSQNACKRPPGLGENRHMVKAGMGGNEHVLNLNKCKNTIRIYGLNRENYDEMRREKFAKNAVKIHFDPQGRPVARPLAKRLKNCRFWPADFGDFYHSTFAPVSCVLSLYLHSGWVGSLRVAPRVSSGKTP